jgi:hypothetical protein
MHLGLEFGVELTFARKTSYLDKGAMLFRLPLDTCDLFGVYSMDIIDTL